MKIPFSVVHRLSYVGIMQWQWRICVWTELPTHHGCPGLWFQVLVFWQQRWSLLLGASALTSVQRASIARCCPCCYGYSIKGQRMWTVRVTELFTLSVQNPLSKYSSMTLYSTDILHCKVKWFQWIFKCELQNVPSSTISFGKLHLWFLWKNAKCVTSHKH